MAILAGSRILASDLQPAPSVQVFTNVYSLASSAGTYSAVNFASVQYAGDLTMWSVANPSRLVAPTAGTYLVHGYVVWPGTLSASDGRTEFRLNGSGTQAPGARGSMARGSSGSAAAVLSGTLTFTAAAQYAELYLNQNSGSACSMIVGWGMTRISLATS